MPRTKRTKLETPTAEALSIQLLANEVAEQLKLGREKVWATKPAEITIRQADLDGAIPKDPCQCVIARCLLRQFGEGLVGAHVIKSATTLFWDTVYVVYKTPGKLRDALLHWDETKVWPLPLDEPFLIPPFPPSQRDRKRFHTGFRYKRGLSKGVKTTAQNIGRPIMRPEVMGGAQFDGDGRLIPSSVHYTMGQPATGPKAGPKKV